MKIDMHFHVVGKGKDIHNVEEDVYFYPDDNNLWFTSILYAMVDEELEQIEKKLMHYKSINTREYIELAYRILSTSEEIDRVVFLGLDAVYDPDSGEFDEKDTDFWVSNRFLSRTVKELNSRLANETDSAKRTKRFFYGASVSPNRRDWLEELAFVASDPDAVLLKLIPSAQHIKLMDPRHKYYFEFLQSKNIPLLCHVGPGYSFPEGVRKRELDNFRYLEGPLSYGVTVIAAHCATPVFPLPIDKDEMGEFFSLMEKYNSGGKVQLWGDTSAFSLTTRVTIVREILKTLPPEWLVNGSDFPMPIDGPWTHIPFVTTDVTMKEYIEIQKTKNPLDKDVRIKRAHRFPNSILENAGKVLRLPEG